MIKSFRDKRTALIASGQPVKRFPPDLMRSVARKMIMLESALVLSDLKSPPGNRLEPLKGARKGQHAILINDQWRICFIWTDSGPSQVEIVDYH